MSMVPSPSTEFTLPKDCEANLQHGRSEESLGAIEEMKETRPTFKELKSIERLRREVLFRVSTHLHLTTSFHNHINAQLNHQCVFLSCDVAADCSGGTTFLADPSLLQWNMPERHLHRFSCVDNHGYIRCNPSVRTQGRLCP